MGQRVCILDYGSGNVRSVANLFQFLKIDHAVSNDESDIKSASHLVLPGVGAFGEAMRLIRERIPLNVVSSEVFNANKPFLGICVGMQVLAETGEEFGIHRGLGWINGKVRKFNDYGLPIPHIGWNEVSSTRSDSLLGEHAKLDFYFVHSYIFDAAEQVSIEATTKYGEEFPSVVRRENIVGVQFHPEKSQKAGMLLLTNFLRL
jgi:imidazole glycerol-phosphate synthase subunit HisH